LTQPATQRPRRGWKYLAIAAAILLAALAAVWYTTTQSFQAYVRKRVVREIEHMTGGRAEIGSFHVVPFHMQVEMRNITVHGKEPSSDVPLAHADSLVAQLKVVSFLRTQFGFHSLILEHPVVHIEIGPDGATTNVPGLIVDPSTATGVQIERLFALSIDRLGVHRGELLWADRKIPLDFSVHGAGLQMDYSFLRRRYESHLAVGKVDTSLQDFRPFAWMTSIDFSLGKNFADVSSLAWNSGRSSVNLSGRISDFRDPHLDGSYEARINLAEAAAIARRNELREGTAEIKGSGKWSLADFEASGTLAMRDAAWQDDQFGLKNVNATSDFVVSDEQIKLSKLQGKLLGGSFSGDAQVDNWLHSVSMAAASKGGREELPEISVAGPPAKKTRGKNPAGLQSGVAHVRLREVSAGEIAAAFDVPAHPLRNFHPAGVATGSVDATWTGSPENADIAFVLNVTPAARSAPHELPVTAKLEGKYRSTGNSLQLTQFSLSTPSSKIQASGTLAASSAVHVSVMTSNMEEWRPLVTALGGPTDLPFRIDGIATFNGSVGGKFSSPVLAGTLVAEDLEFTVPATSRAPSQAVHWDSLAASIQFSPRELSVRGGSLRRGETSADFEFNAALQKGQLSANSPYTARVNLHSVEVASTAALAGFDYPVTGTADVSLQIAGTRAHPQAQGHIHASHAAAYGEEIARFDADLHMDANETALTHIRLTHQDASVTGSAAYTPSTGIFNVDLAGKNFDLARVWQIQQKELPIEGRADFTLQVSGTSENPAVNGRVQMRNLIFDHEPSGGLEVGVSTKNGELQLNAQSQFTHGSVAVDGTVGMHGDYPARITAHMNHLDADALWLAYLGNQLTGHSATSGLVTLTGPLRYPRRWNLNGYVDDLAIELETVKLHNQGPVTFTFDKQTIHIAPLHFVGDGTDVTGHGSIQFTAQRLLDLAADGQADLRLLGGFDPNLAASGGMTVHLTVNGSLSDPLPQGAVQISNATANYAGLPSGLSEMNGSLLFTRNRVHIDQLAARAGGGNVDFKGDVTNFNQQLNFNLTATAKDVRLRYPPGVSSTATAELHWVGTRSASTVSGDVLVTKLAVTPGFDFGAYLQHSLQSAGITPANSPLYNVKLDMAVRTAPELQMKTAVARLSGDANLRVRGSAARPSVLGRADVLEGDATFNGIKFRLERGDITFTNPVAIEPQLNLQATTHVRNYDLDVTVTGTPERLNVNYRSEPPLPKSDIIALLALGRTSGESEQLQQQSGQTLFSDEATNLIINQAINSTVSSRVQRLFGVARIKIDPQGLSTETNPTARGPQVTIEQQFANNLSLTYSTNVAQSSEQIIQGEYFFNRNISVAGSRDQNGVVSFDVRVRRRKK
jgi:translocation and assembly module TamB